jgi:hypothetical protein
MTLQLNGFSTTISADSLDVVRAPITTLEIKPTRVALGSSWFSHYHEGYLYAIAKTPTASWDLGEPTILDLRGHLGLKFVSSMLGVAIEDCFPSYDAVRQRPFTFLGQKEELVAKATNDWDQVPDLLKQFEIRPKYELDPRLIEVRDGEIQIAVTLSLATRWICKADIRALDAAGVALRGLHLIRRNPQPGQKRLVGSIERLEGEQVMLRESFDGQSTIGVSEIAIEGSKECFATCLQKILGKRYRTFMNSLDVAIGKLSGGPGLDQEMSRMGVFLRKQNPISLPGGLTVEIGSRIQVRNSSDFKSFVQLPPAKYCFDRSRTKLNNYAWPGLERFGPYDRESFPKRTPRILVVCPDTVVGRIGQSMRLFRDGISSIKDSRFANGFAGTFRLVNPEFVTLPVKLFGIANEHVASVYRAAIEDSLARDSTYDAAFNIVLDAHATLPDKVNPYLLAKSLLLSNGIPVQECRDSTLTKTPEQLQYVLQNIATALYAKMGGIPWTIDHGETVDDELVIGLGSAELSGSRFEQRQRHIGITTVFRGDGNYLLSNLSRECSYDEYPNELRESTVKVLRDIKTRNNWQKGHTVRIVFHAFKPLKNVEIADIIAASIKEVGDEQNIEFAFLTISQDHSFFLLDQAQKGIAPRYGSNVAKGVFVPERGLVTQLGKYTRLLCTTGPNMVKRPNLPLPHPLLIHLHKQSTYRDFPYLADQVLKFTALSWKSTLPTDRPVTILYSSLIADLLGRLKAIHDWSPAVLNTKLKNSKWFL